MATEVSQEAEMDIERRATTEMASLAAHMARKQSTNINSSRATGRAEAGMAGHLGSHSNQGTPGRGKEVVARTTRASLDTIDSFSTLILSSLHALIIN